jgi:large subunit ribosomal protein L9
LFGSITSQEVAEGLTAKGFAVDKKQVQLDEPIRHTGSFIVKLKLHSQVALEVTVVVEAQS